MPVSPLLLVDDDEANLITLAALLEGEDFDVQTASTMADADRALRARHFDVVVVDYHLQGCSCEALLDVVTETDPATRVIVLSGAPPRHLEAKVHALVPKGERFDVLLDAIRRAPSSSRF